MTIWTKIEKALTPTKNQSAGEDLADSIALILIMALVVATILM